MKSSTLRDVCHWMLTLILGLAAGLTFAADVQKSLPPTVAKVLAAHKVPASGYSAWVQRVDRAEPALAFNADIGRNPASTIKLLTTFLALEDLGPAYQWLTEAYLSGELDDGLLRGDLYLKGYGDPYLVTERVWLLLRALRQQGLQRIGGNLVIDNSYFDLADADPGAFDGQAHRIYNVSPQALLVNFQAINFQFRPNPLTGKVEIIADPRPANLAIRNQLTLVPGPCRGYQAGIAVAVPETQTGGTVSFSGRFGRDCEEYRLSRAVMSAPQHAFGVIRQLWEASGGELTGGLRLGQVPDGLEVFESFDSPSVAEIIRYVNKWSNNVMTRQVFLTLGAERFGPPATLKKAREAVSLSLRERGLDFAELTVDNGAGLSRKTRISVRNLGRLLSAAHQSPFKAEFESSLPIAGLDGTLRKRFRNQELTGRMHIKTGRLNGVFAMAGYLRSRAGDEYIVVAVQNFADAHRGSGEEAHSELLRWVHRL